MQACHDEPINTLGQVKPESHHLRTREVSRDDNPRSQSSAHKARSTTFSSARNRFGTYEPSLNARTPAQELRVTAGAGSTNRSARPTNRRTREASPNPPPPPPPRNATRYSSSSKHCSSPLVTSHLHRSIQMSGDCRGGDNQSVDESAAVPSSSGEHSSRESSESPPMWGGKSNKSATQHLLDLTREERLLELELRLHVLPIPITPTPPADVCREAREKKDEEPPSSSVPLHESHHRHTRKTPA